jgi:ribosomal protein S18 acetylase RimI-like enzyme
MRRRARRSAQPSGVTRETHMTAASIEVMLLTARDLSVLERIEADVFDNPIELQWAAQYLSNPGNLLAVAVQQNVVVGMASAIAYLHPDKPLQLFINEVGVAERCQKQGVGRRLMDALLERGKLVGCTEAWVATEENNLAARALYGAAKGVQDQARAVVYTWTLEQGEVQS